MLDPYQALVQKKLGTEPPKPAASSSFQVGRVSMSDLEGNPYKSFVEDKLTQKKQSAFDKGTADTNASIAKDSKVGFFKDVVPGVPRAFGEVLTQAFTHPIKTIRDVEFGAANVGPKIVNALASIMPGNPGRLPLLGESFGSYVSKESDVEKAIRSGATQYAGYALGGAVAEGAGVTNKLLRTTAGNVLGGQIVTDANTPGERVKQGIFDAVFGVAENLGARAFAKAKGVPYEPNVSVKDIGTGEPVNVGAEVNGGKLTEMKDSGIPPAPPKTADILENPATVEQPKMAKTAYIAKEDLGVDARGQKIMATTEVDSKTGNAIVYYDAKLDTNPKLRQVVWDFEEPHIVSKRLGGGEADFASSLSNPVGNGEMLTKILGDFANKEGRTIDQVATDLASEVAKLSDSNKALSEQFADAYGIYKNKPEMVHEQAPTFAKFMESPVMEGRYSTSAKTADQLARSIPEHESQIKALAKGKVDLPPTDNIISVNGKHYELSGESKQKFLEAKAQHDRVVSNPHSGEGSKKAVGMQLAALKRELTGDYTATEINNLLKREESNYVGKEVVVKINDLEYYGNVAGKSSYGRVPVTLKDGTTIKVEGSNIKDPRTKAEMLAKITDRPESKLFEPKKENAVLPKETKKPEPKKQETAPVKKEPVKKKANEKIAETGLDTGKKVEGKSSFNPEYNTGTKDVEVFMNKMDAENANFSDQRISKSNEDIKDLSRLVGITPEELIKAKPGSIANSETVTAARQMVLNKASELVNAIKGKSAETMTAADRLDIKNKFVQLVAVQKAVAGFRTEASNTLRSFGIELRPGENIAMDELLTNMQKMGMASNGDMALFASKVAESVALTTRQKIAKGALATWYASILSGPKTTVRNIVSTMGNIVTDLGSKAFNPKSWKEIIPSITGLIKGYSEARAGFIAELKDIATLRATDPSSGKFVDFNAPIKEDVFTGKWAKYGQAVEAVGRFLNAQDKFMSAGAQEMEKAAIKVSTPKISDAIAESISKAYSESTVYHGAPKGRVIGAAVKHMTGFLKDAPEARLIVPFVKTVGNVIDRQFDYIPVFSALRLKPEVIAKQAEGIAKEFNITDQASIDLIGKRLRDQQIGRMNTGMALTVASMGLATAGRLSGVGPANYNERIQLQRTGWRPNSIKIGDTWVPYTFLGPISGLFSIAGNVHDKFKYDNNSNDKSFATMLGNGLVGWTQTQLSNSFLSGISDLIDVVNGGKDPIDWLTKTATGLVPIPAALTQFKDIGLNATANLTGDETFKQQYQTKGIIDAIRVKLGLTGDVLGMNKLQPKLDMFGEPMTSDLIFGITPSKDKGAAAEVDNFLINHDSYVTIPLKGNKYTNSDGKDVKLSAAEYTKYIRESGKQIYASLSDSIRSGEFDGMSNAEIRAEIQSISNSIRSDVRDEIIP